MIQLGALLDDQGLHARNRNLLRTTRKVKSVKRPATYLKRWWQRPERRLRGWSTIEIARSSMVPWPTIRRGLKILELCGHVQLVGGATGRWHWIPRGKR